MKSERQRFFEKVDIGEIGDCWIWMAQVNLDGYGRFKSNGRMVLAHRYAYEMFVGPIPAEYPCVLHDCDVPACVNPRHLHVGTHQDNMRELVERNRCWRGSKGQSLPGERNGRAVLTEEDVHDIRRLSNSLTQRQIASIFHVSHVCIGSVLRGPSWSTV